MKTYHITARNLSWLKRRIRREFAIAEWGFVSMTQLNGFIFEGSESCWQTVICREIRQHYKRVLVGGNDKSTKMPRM
jgi:hypothetical protein